MAWGISGTLGSLSAVLAYLVGKVEFHVTVILFDGRFGIPDHGNGLFPFPFTHTTAVGQLVPSRGATPLAATNNLVPLGYTCRT